MIAQGRYPARAVDHEFGVTPTKGTRFIRIKFEILDGEHRGQITHWDGWFTEKTLERTLDSMENCGWDGGSIGSPVGIGSKGCEIQVEHEENEGRTYAKVAWVNRQGGGKLKEDMRMDERDQANLDSEFRASLLERRQKNGNGSRPAQRPAPRAQQPQSRGRGNDDFGPMPDDSDIPF